MRIFAALLFLLALVFACTEEATPAVANPAGEAAGNAAVIRNPIADPAATAADSAAAARLSFAETEYRFGEVKEGAVVRHRFAFTNTGRAPLLITDARSTCGCTVPDYPREPVAPGETAEVEVVFNTTHKHGRQRKPVTITANTIPAMTTIYVDGTVINE